MKKCFALLLLVFIGSGCSLADSFTKKNEETNSEKETVKNQTEETKNSASETGNSDIKSDISKQKDLLSIGAGAYLVKASSEHQPDSVNGWSAFGLIDENSQIGWAGAKGKISNQTIVFRLPAKTAFKTIGFDTAKVDPDSGAKDITIEISDSSADSGFETILSTSLKNAADGQDFPVEKEIGGHFVKITAKNNYGSPEWLEIMEVRGYGAQEAQKPFEKNVSGTYRTEQWGDFHIKQEGTSIVGCYEHDEGLLEGGLDGQIMTLTWNEIGESEKDRGPAVFLFDDEGKNFVGLWAYSDSENYDGKWDGKKISDKVGSCEHFKNLSGENAAGSKIEEELKKDGRVAIYGINFDFNSANIKDESKTTLNQIVSILKENADWKMIVEGHTDNIGGESFNQNLSEKRAEAVKKYLSEAGIDASRLTAKGLGLSKPAANNETEAGRARNRRVELVKE